MPRSNRSLPSGRAEPAPPGGGQARVGWANGENPEITRGAIFSEGRGFRVRKNVGGFFQNVSLGTIPFIPRLRAVAARWGQMCGR